MTKLLLMLFSFLYPYAQGKITINASDSVLYYFYYRPGLKRVILNWHKINGNSTVFQMTLKGYDKKNIYYYGNIIPEKGIRVTTGGDLKISFAKTDAYQYIDFSGITPDTLLKIIEIKMKNVSTTTAESLYYFVNLDYDVPEWDEVRYISQNYEENTLTFTSTKLEDTIKLYGSRGDYAFLECYWDNRDSFLVYLKYMNNTNLGPQPLKLTKIKPNPFQTKSAEYEYMIVDVNPFAVWENSSLQERVIFKIITAPTSTKYMTVRIKYLTKYQRW